jgi:hypothetical protein
MNFVAIHPSELSASKGDGKMCLLFQYGPIKPIFATFANRGKLGTDRMGSRWQQRRTFRYLQRVRTSCPLPTRHGRQKLSKGLDFAGYGTAAFLDQREAGAAR